MYHILKSILVGVGLIGVFPIFVSAATLQVSGGQLTGATGVTVDGSLYNVEFVDTTCAAAFSGCDSDSDFIFDHSQSMAASVALMTEVFIGAYDDSPSLTRGSNYDGVVVVFTPFALELNGWMRASYAQNSSYEPHDLTSSTYQTVESYDWSVVTHTPDWHVFARWTPSIAVPEPSTLLMIIPGLIGLAYTRRKRVLQ